MICFLICFNVIAFKVIGSIFFGGLSILVSTYGQYCNFSFKDKASLNTAVNKCEEVVAINESEEEGVVVMSLNEWWQVKKITVVC